MPVNLFLGRIHGLCSSLPLNRNPAALASSNVPPLASPPKPYFAVQYLVQSCGFSFDEALKASKFIQPLKSPDKPDAVLRFLREIGVNELDIKIAVSREARILLADVEKNWSPNIAKLQELGFSIEEISGIIARHPYIFRGRFVRKINLLMGVVGSVENFSLIFKLQGSMLFSNDFEKVIMPNLSFLQEQCSLSPGQIIRLMMSGPKLISSRPDVLKMEVERAEELGVARSSETFIDALLTVSYQNQCTIDAKINNLRSIGFSQEEVALMISKAPMLLRVPEKLVRSKMEYLIKDTGCDKIDVVQYPVLLMYSLENRLIPRNIVRKILMWKGLHVTNQKFANLIQLSEEKFVKKFVLPYEHATPGLHRAYTDASTGKIGGVESFKSISS